MARRSSGGRSGGGFLRPQPASKPSKSPALAPAPAPAPAAKAPAPMNSGFSSGGGLGSVVAEGMAFGGGSAIAHRAVDALAGPRVVQVETVATSAPATQAAPINAIPEACRGQNKAFQDCLESSGSDISRCQFYMDMLIECHKAGSGSGSGGLMA